MLHLSHWNPALNFLEWKSNFQNMISIFEDNGLECSRNCTSMWVFQHVKLLSLVQKACWRITGKER